MPSMKSIIELPEVKALVYGEPKTGKSTFAAGFPKPAFLILAEPDKSQYAGMDIEYEQFSARNADDFDKLIDTMEMLQSHADSGEFPYKSIIVDSLTEIAAIMEARILRVNRREYQMDCSRPYNDRDMGMRIQDWGIFKSMIENFVRNVHSMPCHTCMIAHEYVKEAGDNKVLKGCLSISGNFGETGAKLFNTVLRTRTKGRGENIKFYMQTKPEQLFTAGLWGGHLPAEWENPSFEELERSFKEWKQQQKGRK